MKRCARTLVFILSLLFAVSAWSQDDSVVQSLDATGDDSPQSAPYDDLATPGQIHGFIPDTWTAGMITLADLQTEEGQDWLNGLMAAQSAQAQTQYVCQNPGPTTTSSNTGDFYFYDLPAGSYAVGACMQTPDGHWRSGAQVLALDAGQDELIALGPPAVYSCAPANLSSPPTTSASGSRYGSVPPGDGDGIPPPGALLSTITRLCIAPLPSGSARFT